jgi:hypothetical protein
MRIELLPVPKLSHTGWFPLALIGSLRGFLVSGFLVGVGALGASGQMMVGGPVGQSAGSVPATSAAQLGVVPAHADLRVMTRLVGHLPAWVRAENDAGPVVDGAGGNLILDVVLKRGAVQQAAFDRLLADQQDPKSPRYHSWLTPMQIGLAYGPAQSDLDVLTGWLAGQGLHVDEVAPSRMFVRVSAPVRAVANAFSTSFRMFTVNGLLMRSATSEPAIPAAFEALVGAIGGLSEVPDEPMHRSRPGPAEVEPGVSAAASAATSSLTSPSFTSSGGGNHYVVPGDFAVIYDVPLALTAATDGTGQKVAIIGRSQVNPLDVTNYLISVGLTPKLPNVVIPPLGMDPGQAGGGDQGEATLDVQRVMGTAPGAQADLVVSANAAGGLRTAIQYNVQTLLDPVMTISFGSCEANAGLANVNLYTALFSQAAAEGIAVFVSSGDAGAAGCDRHGSAPPTTPQIASINYLCSSGFATCVGGTEFAEGTNSAQYWSTSNSSTRTSALSYIPEGVWNEPMTTATPPTLVIGAGGGGVSIYTPKPLFQAGPGVPADGFRDTPDVSFTSSGHDGYFGCLTSAGATCVRDPVTGLFFYEYFYGTSAAAPSMAGVAALLNQKMGAAQGNLNPLLYRLGANAANGVFHDTTVASSGVSGCTAAVPSLCNNSTPSATLLTGGLAGYVLTAGYDLASGLGSPDVANLFAAAASAGVPTTTTIAGSFGLIPSGQSLSFTAMVSAGTGTPTGLVQFYGNGVALGSAVTIGANGTASLTTANTLPLGTDLVTAAYSGDTTFAGSNSTALTVMVPAGTTVSATTLVATPNPTLSTQTTTLTVTVAAGTGVVAVPTGSINLYINFNGTKNLVATGLLSNGTATFVFTFSAGTFNFSASYAGDATYGPSASTVVPIISSAGSSTTMLTGQTSLPGGSPLSVTAMISGLPVFSVLSSVTLMDGATALVSLPVGKPTGGTTVTVNYLGTTGLSNGYHTITAVFSGDRNSLGSTSAPLIVAVGIPQAITVTPAAASLSVTAGAAQGNTDVLTITSSGAFAGIVTVSCTVAYNGSGMPTNAPTCMPSTGSLTLTPEGTGTTTLTIGTTIPHATGGGAQALLGGPAGVLVALLVLVPMLGSRRRVRAGRTGLLMASIVAAGLLGLAGCGSKSSGSAPPLVGTTPGVYTITATFSGTGTGTVSATTTIALTVR